MGETLRVDNLYVGFETQQGQVKALNGVSLVQEEGQVFCLVGESGAGKSTLALATMGLLPTTATVTGGSILFDGVDLLRASPEYVRRLRGKEMSMVFQESQAALNPVKFVGDQIEEVILEHTGVTARVANGMAQDILRAMGLPDPRRIMGQYPFNLSGGMCQRVMLAIALVLGSRLLVADEPTSGLDVTLQAEILERLKRLCREQHASILLITHDIGVVATMTHRVGLSTPAPLWRLPRWFPCSSGPNTPTPGHYCKLCPGWTGPTHGCNRCRATHLTWWTCPMSVPSCPGATRPSPGAASARAHRWKR